jgi:hypothetical protein
MSSQNLFFQDYKKLLLQFVRADSYFWDATVNNDDTNTYLRSVMRLNTVYSTMEHGELLSVWIGGVV